MTSEALDSRVSEYTFRVICGVVEGVGSAQGLIASTHYLFLGMSVSEPMSEQDHIRAGGATECFPGKGLNDRLGAEMHAI